MVNKTESTLALSQKVLFTLLIVEMSLAVDDSVELCVSIMRSSFAHQSSTGLHRARHIVRVSVGWDVSSSWAVEAKHNE